MMRLFRRGHSREAPAPTPDSTRSGSGSYPGWGVQLFGGLGGQVGGFANQLSGAGGAADKNSWSYYRPTIGLTRQHYEVVYVQSWAAKKFIDIPVEDSLIRWRDWPEAETSVREAMMDAEKEHMVQERLAAALRAGRLMGTGFLMIVTKNAPLSDELMPDQVREGDLANLIPLDRFQCEVIERNNDIYDPEYGGAMMYRVALRDLPAVEVHPSRMLRFDGIRPAVTDWDIYDNFWGVSELVPVMVSVMEDSAVTAATAHLVEEASLMVMKMRHYREALAGQDDPDRASPLEVLSMNAQMRSVYRTVFADAEDEIQRLDVGFGAVPDLMDRFAARLAAAADIPMTRFWGQAPKGLNATGESDMRNYALRVKSMQHRMLDEPVSVLDEVLARSSGVGEPPEYEWLPLVDLSQLEMAEITEKKVLALGGALAQGMMDEEEARTVLSGDEIIGELEANPAFLQEARAEEREAKAMIDKQMATQEKMASAPPKLPPPD